MKKTLIARVPQKEPESTIYAKVPTALYEKAKKLLDSKDIEWKELIKAALEQFIDEQKGA